MLPPAVSLVPLLLATAVAGQLHPVFILSNPLECAKALTSYASRMDSCGQDYIALLHAGSTAIQEQGLQGVEKCLCTKGDFKTMNAVFQSDICLPVIQEKVGNKSLQAISRSKFAPATLGREPSRS